MTNGSLVTVPVDDSVGAEGHERAGEAKRGHREGHRELCKLSDVGLHSAGPGRGLNSVSELLTNPKARGIIAISSFGAHRAVCV